jgi:hypothetical protein
MRNQTNDTILQGTYTWTGAGSSTAFDLTNNWINQATGQPDAVPNARDEGNFIGAGLCTGTGTLGALYADGVGGWGFFLDGTISVASFASFAGTDWIDGGTMTVQQAVTIGLSTGSGVLTILQNSALAAAPGGGPMDVDVGWDATTGALVLSGAGAILATAGGNLYDGYAAGNASAPSVGSVSISAGAHATAGSALVGEQGTGSLTVTGAASVLTLSNGIYGGQLNVGIGGNGTATITDFATVTCNSLEIGGLLGTAAGPVNGTGVVNVALASLGVTGSNPQIDAFDIAAGSTLSLSFGAHFSAGAKGTVLGTLDIADANTRAVINGNLVVGGALAVSANASLALTSGALLVGAPSVVASVTVTDATVSVGAGGLFVGSVAGASVTVSQAGTMLLGTTSPNNYVVEVGGGINNGSGALTVTGAGSLFDSAGAVLFGSTGPASFADLAGARVVADSFMAFGMSTTGTVGGGSTLAVAGAITITESIFAVSGGSHVSASTPNSGAALGVDAAGTLTVTGAGTTISTVGLIQVGAPGSLLAISGGAQVSNTSTNNVNSLSLDVSSGYLGGSGIATLSITGKGSSLIASGGITEIGDQNGAGQLILSAGAALTSLTSNSPIFDGTLGASIGGTNGETSPSTATVTTGASWLVTGGFVIGNSAYGGTTAGTLSVTQGGHVSISGALALDNAGSELFISGPGSSLSAGYVFTSNNTPTVIANGGVLKVASQTDLSDVTLQGGTISVTGELGLTGIVSGYGVINAGSFGASSNGAGTIAVTSGTLRLNGAATFLGGLTISGGGTLVLGGAGVDTTNLSFAAGGGTLAAVLPQKIADHISFWGAGDVIDLTTIDVVSDSYANGTLTLKGAHQTFSPLHFTGSYTSANFVLTPDHHGGTLITFHTGG